MEDEPIIKFLLITAIGLLFLLMFTIAYAATDVNSRLPEEVHLDIKVIVCESLYPTNSACRIFKYVRRKRKHEDKRKVCGNLYKASVRIAADQNMHVRSYTCSKK